MLIPKLSFLKLTSSYCVLLKDSKYYFDDVWTQCWFPMCICSLGCDRGPDHNRWAGSNMSFSSRPRQEGWWDKVSQLSYEGGVSRFSFSPWDILGGKVSSSLSSSLFFQWKKNLALWVVPKDDSCQGTVLSQKLHWHNWGSSLVSASPHSLWSHSHKHLQTLPGLIFSRMLSLSDLHPSVPNSHVYFQFLPSFGNSPYI